MSKFTLLGLLLASQACFAVSGNTVATDNVKAHLVSEVDSVGPGQSFWVALDFDIREGWHTYWRNPGDSGQATKLTWTLPAGFTAGDIVWTTPHRFELPPLVNYGYAKHALHLVEITAPRDLKPGTALDLRARANWLVCADVCIPESADLRLDLRAGAGRGAIDPKAAALFADARRELPNAAPGTATAQILSDRLLITLGKDWDGSLAQIESLQFFPYDEGGIEYAAPQTLTRTAEGLVLAMKLGYQPPTTGAVRGLLLATEQSTDEPVALDVAARLTGTGAANLSSSRRYAASAGLGAPAQRAVPGLPILLLLAGLGGLILNLMPCVFPVLTIKALHLVEQAKKHPREVRAKGVAFAAGVIGSMLLLAAVLLALRAGGEQIGWGFQLQSPLFVTLMVYLLLAVGLNMSGVFEIGGGLAGAGDSLTHGESLHASFFTGVLTTLVATPCSAPFMAAAIGAALTQSRFAGLGIFCALGAGLALPFLLLSFAPWLRRGLPKPGAWMDTLKQVFAFPMYASAAWLLWVLAQQTSASGLGAALAGAILVALAAWAYQQSRMRSSGGRAASLVISAVALLLAIALPLQLDGVPSAEARAQRGSAAHADDAWQPYDEPKLAALTAAGTPVLVNFTASWCLTCLVNERNAFADPAVQEIFRGKGVTLMKGDWTNRDPKITKALAAFGRAGVPLYVVYNAKPGSADPLVLPQLLTASLVRDVFAGLPGRDLK